VNRTGKNCVFKTRQAKFRAVSAQNHCPYQSTVYTTTLFPRNKWKIEEKIKQIMKGDPWRLRRGVQRGIHYKREQKPRWKGVK
jgi:hypothetical protein